jgi:hypothetical protein
MVMYNAPASVATLKTFYEQSLSAAGWTPGGLSTSSAESVLLNYQKGDQSVMISIASMGGNTSMVVISVP